MLLEAGRLCAFPTMVPAEQRGKGHLMLGRRWMTDACGDLEPVKTEAWWVPPAHAKG